jgi:hypothetical protein
MRSHQTRLYLAAGTLIVTSWLTLAFADPDGEGGGITETVRLGYFLGSLFGHPTLAAAWTALGPGKLSWRLPLSIVWVGTLGAAIAVNIAINGGPDGVAIVLGACFLSQWFVLQIPLWTIAVVFRLQLRHVNDVQSQPKQLQFGIRQLIIVTAIVGVMLGIGRMLVANLGQSLNWNRETPLFIFLAMAAIVMTLPLLLAALMQRWSFLSVILALTLIALATIGEAPLLQTSVGSGARPNTIDLAAINATTALFVLVFTGVVRLCGYRLASTRAA